MNTAPIRLLCTGDLHLGRYPSRLPDHDEALSIGGVWDALVDYATSQDVDAVVLTGDVVDQENRFFESYGPLERGLARLDEAEIEVFAVAGNHDYDVFPRLAEQLGSERFHLLGTGGRWTTAPLRRDGQEVLHFVGWSFPRRHVDASPLERFPVLEADVPLVGVLHADLDAPASRYAPVSREALVGAPPDVWLLGHIHRPQRIDLGRGMVLYPGSPQPLDPGERGAHGPWLVEIAPESGTTRAEQLPMASVRYDEVEVDLSETETKEDFEAAVTDAVRACLQQHGAGDHLRRCLYRVRLTGRTPLHRRLDAYSAPLCAELDVQYEDVHATIEEVRLETRPAYDLEQLAESSGPPGALARLLVGLQAGDEQASETNALLQTARQALDDIYRARAYAPLRADEATSAPPDRAQVRELLLRQGLLLLDEMLTQSDDLPSHE